MKIRNNIKKHLKDIDFRTRQQRQLEWEKDFQYWMDDLEKHKVSGIVKLQIALLNVIWSGLLANPEDTIRSVITRRNALRELPNLNAMAAAEFRLLSAVCWYIE